MQTTLFVMVLAAGVQAPDTVVVHADDPPMWGSDARLVEELRIGRLDGPPEYTFGSVSGLAIGEDGEVFVADVQVPAIRMYGPDGTWRRNLGREGEGPGEYIYIYGMRSLANGDLAILDPRNARVTFFRDGEHLRSFPSRSGLFSADIFGVDSAGRSYVKTTLRADVPARELPDGGRQLLEKPPGAWIVLGQSGEVLDTMLIPPEAEEGGGFVLAGHGGYYRPFTVMTVSTLSPHGYLVWARNHEYALFRPLPDGRVLRIERAAERVPIQDEERRQWQDWVEYFEAMGRERGVDGDYGPIPREKPFIRHLFVDDDARIWVARYAEAVYRPYTDEEREARGDRPDFEWRQPLVWDVFRPEGSYLGEVTLPHGTSLLAARGTTVWGSQAGSFDEEYVVRFRITGSGVGR